MLKNEGSYILPDNVPAFEFLNLEGDKISTSRNWAVWLHEYLQDFPDMQDVLRYVLASIAPETKDNDFTWKDFQARNNSELVAILGNFVNRTMVLTHKFFDGNVPPLAALTPLDEETLETLKAAPARISASMDLFRFREALSEFMNVARLGNKYLTDCEPWKIKDNPERVGTIINICIQICANLAVLAETFLPFTAKKIQTMLGTEHSSWDAAGRSDLVTAGSKLQQPSLLFSLIEDATIEQQKEKLINTKKMNEVVTTSVLPIKANIEFADFGKMDLRTGLVLEAEKVAKTKKLMKLKVDVGTDVRTIVSGVAEYFEPEQLIGKRVVVLANLAPKDLKGITSQGMILFAENADGKLILVSSEDMASAGSLIK
jgi:methionyl-tRNA synthetase